MAARAWTRTPSRAPTAAGLPFTITPSDASQPRGVSIRWRSSTSAGAGYSRSARERVSTERLPHVAGLYEMDASDLKFPAASFDTVVAMYVMTVVPDPEKVMRELARVCRPGGEVLIVNHFSAEQGKPGWEGMRGWVERRMAPFADMLGWRPVFDIERVLVCEDLSLLEKRGLRPWGLFTMMRFRKAKDARAAA